MSVLGVVLLVFFVIVAILLILLVLVQNEDGDSLGGIFAGGSNTAFGSRSGNVLTRATTVLGTLFLVISLGMALLSRSPMGSGVERAGRQSGTDLDSSWWQEDAGASYVPPLPDFPAETPLGSLDFSIDHSDSGEAASDGAIINEAPAAGGTPAELPAE